MDNSDIAISIDSVTKDFKLPHERVDSVKSLFTQPLRRRGVTTQHTLKDVSFDIKKGEFFGIVGRNGSGKSTLLKIIANIYQPNAGKVRVDGRLVPFIELGVGFNPELSGRENVYLNGALMGFSQKEIKAKYDSIVDFAEIEQFMDQKLKNYSSGMQVRLAFSVATILAESDILLIDEVLAVGDADFQRKCFDYFRKLKQANKTVVFVSHDMGAVRDFCDRAVLIEDGRITVSGSVKEVALAYAKLFGGEKAQDGRRRGSKEVRFNQVKSEKSTYTNKDEYLTFRIKYKVDKDVENPIFGMSIKNSAGTVMAGTNTDIKEENIKILLSKQTGEIVWRIQNILNEGNYSLDVTCIGRDGHEFDWWEDSLIFGVSRPNHTPFAVEPPISFSMKVTGTNKGA